jgi:hypothetical protein
VLEKCGWSSGVLEYCAYCELHPRSGLKVLVRRFVLLRILASGVFEYWSIGRLRNLLARKLLERLRPVLPGIFDKGDAIDPALDGSMILLQAF